MKVTINEQEGRQVVALSGDLDTTASSLAERDMEPLFSRSDCDIVVDCAELSYISSSGLRLLLNIYKHVRQNGHRVTLRGIRPDSEIHEVLELAGFFQLFAVEGIQNNKYE